ncbi:hypothetical protein Godav_023488, partial [Gossypium davidsonii]|nr:hypothetical protein [Gossypium davidsonii]
EILFIILSPTGKPYSFGHPSIDSVAKQLLKPNQPLNETIHSLVEAYCKLVVDLIEILDKQVGSYLTVSLNREKLVSLRGQFGFKNRLATDSIEGWRNNKAYQ